MELPYRSIHIANKLAACGNISKITKFKDINCGLFRQLFDCFCLPFIADEYFLDDLSIVRNDIDYMSLIIDYISREFLEIDLSRTLNAQAICSGNPDQIHKLLSIFDSLRDCLFKTNGNEIPTSVPRHMRRKIVDCGKASVLFSPRTSLNRKRSKTVPVATRKSSFKVENKAILRNLGIPRSSVDLMDLEMRIRQTKAEHLLHVLKRECLKTEARLKSKASKVLLKRAIDRHLIRAKQRKNHLLLLKKANLTCQNIEKDRKRKFSEENARVNMKKEQSSTADEEMSIIDDDFTVDNDYSTAEHAQTLKFVKSLAKEWNAMIQDQADSIENASHGRISSMTDGN